MTIQIEQDCNWQRIVEPDPPENIVSGGMGPCVSIFIYDTESKITYACHYTSPDIHHSDDVKDMIDNALTEFKNSKKIDVHVSGAIVSDKYSAEKRTYIEQLLKSKFSTNAELNFKWPCKGIEMVELVFEPTSGVLHEPKT